MTVHNKEIAEIFNRLADLLEIEGANEFRVRAYRNAARVIGGLSPSLAELVAQGEDLSQYPGIGDDLAEKIQTLVQTGELPLLQEVSQRVPTELADLMGIEGLGPKGVKALYDELAIRSVEDLDRAIKEGRVRELKGFGEKTENRIREGLEQIAQGEEKRTRLVDAEEIAEPLRAYLAEAPGVDKIEVAGSYRRRKETVGDLDILVACADSGPVMERFVGYEEVADVASRGETRSTVILASGLHVDLRVVPKRSYGAALHYFTGSQAHNIAVRKRGVEQGYKINEYGVYEGEEAIAGAEEAEVFRAVDLPWIAPELREDRGEIETAEKGELPELITLGSVRGDLHCHTKATDGADSLPEMAEAARVLGYDYLAITEHSRRVAMAKGLDEKRLRQQIEEIDRLNEGLEDITLLKGIEVDILEDGTLDLPDSVLAELDLTICSAHYGRDLSRKKQTERILKAMDNPHFRILGHPTGRLINERAPYEVDIERLVEAAAERGCALEVNAQPSRLDLRDVDCQLARDRGAMLALGTDAHNAHNLGNMRFGVDQARRGWVGPDDVINTRDLKGLRQALQRR